MAFRTPTPRLLVIPTLVLLLAACAPSVEGAGADGDLSLDIATPADRAEIAAPIEVQLDASVPLGEPETGNHHVHLYFDTDIGSEDYQLVYADSAVVERELSPGEHTIIASLRNADHSDAGPTSEITITVADDGGTGSDADEDAGGESAAPASDDGGFDY